MRTAFLAAGLLMLACSPRGPQVVIYTSLDPVFGREILRTFEHSTGIRVLPVFDTEATKTTGLVERLRRERRRPRCDVFWNNEPLRTIRLAEEGVLETYRSPAAAGIDPRFRDPLGRWTGFAARARAIAFDPRRVDAGAVPRSHAALLDRRWRGRIVIANPEFGTTGSHLAMILAAWGEPRCRDFLLGLRQNDVEIVGGNSTARDRVVAGIKELALTDTDDIEVARRRGESIAESLLVDDGVIVIPNTVALVAGAPHPAEARRLIDYLLSRPVEAKLAASSSRQIPLRDNVTVPAGGLRLDDLAPLPVDLKKAAAELPRALKLAREILR